MQYRDVRQVFSGETLEYDGDCQDYGEQRILCFDFLAGRMGAVGRKEITMQLAIAPPPVPVGMIKSFGPFGPKYEVGYALGQLADGDWLIEVTMIETGEKAEYRWTHLNEDPQAH